MPSKVRIIKNEPGSCGHSLVRLILSLVPLSNSEGAEASPRSPLVDQYMDKSASEHGVGPHDDWAYSMARQGQCDRAVGQGTVKYDLPSQHTLRHDIEGGGTP